MRPEIVIPTVMITVGTGIGGGIFANEQILSGHNFTAGEIGYLPIGNADWQSLASASAPRSYV